MDGAPQAEFDRYAEEYGEMHEQSIRASGESPDFFARYKIADMRALWDAAHPAAAPRAILDYGGGIGGSSPHLRALFPGTALTLADPSARSLEIAAARGIEGLDTLHFDGGALPLPDAGFDAGFDMVLIACVLHHVPAERHDALLREARRVTRPGGFVCVFEHNPWNPLTRRAVDQCPFDADAVLIDGPEMRRRMRAAGFAQVDLAYRIFFPGALAALRPAERGLTWLPLGAQYRAVGRV